MYDYTYYSNVLVHHGIKGQKHGERRYQNPDGSLTPAGRERYGVGKKKSSLAANVKKAASDFTKGVKKTGKGVKKVADKRKAAKLKAEQEKIKAERESWFKDKKSMYKHFNEMTTDERTRALKAMDQFDQMERYKANSTGRNLDLINKGLKAMGVNGFQDLMKGVDAAYKLSRTIKKDNENDRKKAEADERRQKEEADKKRQEDAENKKKEKEAKKKEKEAEKAEKQAKKEEEKQAREEQALAEKELRDAKNAAKKAVDVMFKPKKGSANDVDNLSDLKSYYSSRGVDKNKINEALATSSDQSSANVKLAQILADMLKEAK